MKRVVLIGAGNVGYHLGRHLHASGVGVPFVCSRTRARAEELAVEIGAQATATIAELPADADLYVLAVRDDAIPAVAWELSGVVGRSARVVHTSGATPSVVLAPFFDAFGVFYPLQTFSRSRPVDWSRLPICYFSPDAGLENVLADLSSLLSSATYRIDDRARAVLHVAAVFVNNFTNYLYHTGEQMLASEGLPFELLIPLIGETAAKIQSGLPPADAQTGPAVRGDQATIERHLAYLEAYPEWREVYRVLTERIARELDHAGTGDFSRQVNKE